MTGHKATGVDKLSAGVLKSRNHRSNLCNKLALTFTSWMNHRVYPKYLNCARIIPLSKEANDKPAYGAIRTISVLPTLSKIFEKVILGRLKSHITDHELIHEKQRGFQPKKSTLHNLNDLTKIIAKAKDVAQRQRSLRIPMTARSRQFIVFIDLEKAFDRVRRSKLLAKMNNMSFDTTIIDNLKV